ncbi:hypothetical protein ACMD2_03655, partial [Ananas comosus]
MSLYRQSGGGDRSASRSHTDHHPPIEGQVHHRPPRLRRAGKPHHRLRRPPPATLFVVALTLVALLAFLGSRRLFRHNERAREEDDGGRREMGLVMTLGQNVGKDQIGDNGDSARGISGNVEGLSNGAEEMDPDDEYDDDVDDDGDDDVADDDDGGVGVDHDDGDDVDKVGEDAFVSALERDSANGEEGGTEKNGDRTSGDNVKRSGSRRKSRSKRKPKRRKFSGSTCEMKFLQSTAQLVEPSVDKKFARFSLQYTDVENQPIGSKDWEPRFAGHQSLQEREKSYHAGDQKINCGFIEGTGFDLSKEDREYMSKCHVVVSSCIFGNSDHLRPPTGKKITQLSKKNVCFAMFLDESTLQTLLSEGLKMDGSGFVGLWKIIVVKNLPYDDMRRVGKIPKFLPHRLFPSSRYSIWLDSKLRLDADPYLIIEYLLWRKNAEYAISNHYSRHSVEEEVQQNKRLNKFNHTIIDQQYNFYRSDGLNKFNSSNPDKLLPSYVPEGSFIVREHTPMSNLFSCLWFNEVDRFTPRDQLSFAYTYLKLRRMNPRKPFRLNMFKDCERRAITKLFHHRAVVEPR